MHLLIVISFTLLSLFARAQTCGTTYSGQDCVAGSASKSITAFSTCAKVTNSHASGKAIFVPINTSAEWSAFRTKPPAGVTIGSCLPLAVDATTIARVTPAYVNNGNSMTTASFTPASNSLIVVCVGTDSGTDTTNDATLTVSDSLSHTWTKVQEWDPNSGATEGSGSHASLWYTQITTAAAMTISMTPTKNSLGAAMSSFKGYIFTNYDSSSPIGASNHGSSAAASITPTVYTSTTAGSIPVGCASIWGTGVGSSSTDTGDGLNGNGDFAGVSTYRGTPTASAGTAISINFQTTGYQSGNSWHWTAMEVKPAP